MKKINESAYSVLMTFTRFVREQRATKKEVMSQKMNELYDELRVEMDSKGWSNKGRNNDFLPGGAKQLKVNPEVPGILRSHPFTWDEEGNTMLGLSILLDKIEQHFN